MREAQYDRPIQNAVDKYLHGRDWRLYKSQLMAESNLKPDAVSPVGAEGIAQFMPGTWGNVSSQLNFPAAASPLDAHYAIPAGAYYMGRLIGKWTAPRPDIDRYCLALASYNAGFSNIIEAQDKAGGANDYAVIIRALPQVTGSNAGETVTYVLRILNTFNRLVTR